MNRSFVRFVLVGAALLLAGAAPLFAQATGQITGIVTDSSGGVVPGVTVEAANTGTGQVRSAVTGADGFYTIPLLNPGSYSVRASLTGFRTSVRDGIEVVVNGTARVDHKLQIGEISEQVTVEIAAPLVETKNATLGVVIDEKKVVDLPLNGRNFTQLGTLIPGVVAPPTGLGGAAGDATPGGFGNVTGGFNVNGMRNQSNNFLLDGSPNNDSFNTGFVLRPPPDAIEQFKILTHSYDAQYGRNAGSVVNVVTKSGTNDWHGSGWEFNRDDSLQSKNYFAAAKPALKQNQYGGGIGGPLAKNKLFMYSYYEGYNNKQGVTDTRTVLSQAQRDGNFAGGAAIKDPLTGQPFARNAIPTDRLSPISLAILNQFIPLPNSASNRVVRSPNVNDTRRQFGTRFDYRIGNDHSILGRYMVAHTKNVNPLGGSNFSPAGNTAVATLQDVMASDTWLLRQNMINVARVGVNRIDATPTVTSGLDLKTLGFNYPGTNATAAGIPSIVINGYFTAGDAQQPFASRLNQVFGFSDDFTWVSGPHAFKFGGEIRRDQIRVSFINRPNGDFTFTGQYTGNAAADFLLGLPVQFRQGSGDPNLDGASWTYGIYGQDEFRIGSRVTLNYGVRYEINRPFADKQNHLNAFHPGQQSTVFPQAPTGLVYPGDAGVPPGTYPTDKNNVAPRLSAIWDPKGDGRTSVRGAWGLFYDTLPGQGDFFQNGTLAPPFQPLTQVDFPQTIPMATPLAGASGPAGFPPGLIFIGWGPEFKTPVVQHYNATIQHQLGGYWGIEAGYVGSRGKNLPMFIEVNPTIPNLTTLKPGPRLYPAFSLIRPTFSVAESWYNALQTSARMRPWHGLNMMLSYTLSHTMDDASGLNIGTDPRPLLAAAMPGQPADPAGVTHPIADVLAREKGDALFDARHRFVASFGFELPRLEGKGTAARLVLGGWQLNGIIQAQSGFPFTVGDSNNVNLTSVSTVQRPNVTCDPNADAPNTTAQWFNTNCFSRLTLAANAGQNGNEARNAVRGPGFSRTDLSLFKNFPAGGSRQIQLRVEAFDVFNQVRYAQPGNIIGSPIFGVITATATADDERIVQLGIKFIF